MDRLIDKKNNYNIPYYATKNTIKQFPTDMNVFPYTRYYRGIYNLPMPVIFDRKVGYRKIDYPKIYDYNEGIINSPAEYYFQIPCSTTLQPVFSENNRDIPFQNSKRCVFVSI